MSVVFSHEKEELLEEILLNAYANGNTVEPKPFIPTPEQWKMITQMCTATTKSIKDHHKLYGDK